MQFKASASLRKSYFQTVLFWNPVITLVLCLYLGWDEDFWANWGGSLFLATTVVNVCFLGIRTVKTLERIIYRLQGRTAPEHSVGWAVSISLMAMPIGTLIGQWATQMLFSRLGLHWEGMSWEHYKESLLVGALIAGIFFLFRTRSDAQELAKTAQNALLKSQVSALTAQMNPHLLFNALNTVAALVPEDPAKAENTILKLSELYRGVLDSSRKSTHSLAKELEICKSYLAVEHARFGERLQALIEVDESLSPEKVEIPVLTIQPLLENAVKHGLSSRASGGRVHVAIMRTSEGLRIRVEDDGIGLGNSEKKGSGTGIANCRERLKLTYGEKGSLEIRARETGGTQVMVSVPC